MKRATAYLRTDAIYLHSSSETTDGVWILSSPCVKLNAACPDRELGEHVLRALAESRTGIPHPKQWGGLVQPLLQLANVKSWGAFARRASCVQVEEEALQISVIRTDNLGPQYGFSVARGGTCVIEGRNPEEIGSLVHQALLPERAR